MTLSPCHHHVDVVQHTGVRTVFVELAVQRVHTKERELITCGFCVLMITFECTLTGGCIEVQHCFVNSQNLIEPDICMDTGMIRFRCMAA